MKNENPENPLERCGFTWDEFYSYLREFDKAVCEANAVSQGVGVRMAEAYQGWSTYIFARICIHASIMISDVPKSRWAKRDYDFWDFSSVASHLRAILEAELLFFYLSETPESTEQWSAKLNVMHMNDCVKRIEMFTASDNSEALNFYHEQQKVISDRLHNNPVFMSLDSGTRKRCLAGKAITIPNRDELLVKLGKDPVSFKIMFDFLSHYTHILPMSYYKMEPNGRGTGCYNEFDFGYIIMGMMMCTESLVKCTDRMIEIFPDVKRLRKGTKSKFTLGPKPTK
ncbi:hypothetical protein [Enterobacter bugandensis]|uniref:hypothetical protein n=1 Tax=Enterobacter bugandensis TaxID=881260 RepID=UPI001F1CE182|nr:hypothetical protein [Enterobacter bugandensis]MCK6943746.1 hypothetical protein [Enterobacter bugandensis]MCK7422862.1 hypothetical protein [Enterobacter bugandensis]MCK7432834.1 hypothetical protein [Enterobacter bugandensis]MEA5252117.1 hypothetical protein [Enterobacter bugandensis]